MTAPKIVRAAKARRNDDSPAASREVLLEALLAATEIVADRDLPPTARQRALASIGTLTKQLDDIDARARAEAAKAAADEFRWGDLSTVRAV